MPALAAASLWTDAFGNRLHRVRGVAGSFRVSMSILTHTRDGSATMTKIFIPLLLAALGMAGNAMAQEATKAQAPKAAYDAALAQKFGADEMGMRSYVLVILHSGPVPVPAGEARDAMFRGHFANMKRLAAEGTLVLAGPLDGVDGWRGLFILAVDGIDAAKAAVATDPVVIQGEMVPEFHVYYGSAGLMAVNELHARINSKDF
jgi:uncharacterized protein YciI